MPLVLAFNLAPERAARVRTFCAVRRLGFRLVAPEAHGRSVGALAGILPEPDGTDGPVQPFDEEMLVLCSLSEAQLDQFLRGLRASGMPPVALKAVLTPSNARWTPARLCAELKREREAFQ